MAVAVLLLLRRRVSARCLLAGELRVLLLCDAQAVSNADAASRFAVRVGDDETEDTIVADVERDSSVAQRELLTAEPARPYVVGPVTPDRGPPEPSRSSISRGSLGYGCGFLP
jgi:hypothetical protein